MSTHYKLHNKDIKTTVQKIKESMDKAVLDNKLETKESDYKLKSDPKKKTTNPLRQLGVVDTFAGTRASINYNKKKVIGENTMSTQLPIKEIILEADFLRNRPLLSASLAAGLGGAITHNYMTSGANSPEEYMKNGYNKFNTEVVPAAKTMATEKYNQVTNETIPTIKNYAQEKYNQVTAPKVVPEVVNTPASTEPVPEVKPQVVETPIAHKAAPDVQIPVAHKAAPDVQIPVAHKAAPDVVNTIKSALSPKRAVEPTSQTLEDPVKVIDPNIG